MAEIAEQIKWKKREIQAPKCEIFLEFRMRNIMRLEGSFKNSMKSRTIKLPACIQWLLNIMHNPPTLRGYFTIFAHLPRIKSFIYHFIAAPFTPSSTPPHHSLLKFMLFAHLFTTARASKKIKILQENPKTFLKNFTL
mgnify:FL=1